MCHSYDEQSTCSCCISVAYNALDLLPAIRGCSAQPTPMTGPRPCTLDCELSFQLDRELSLPHLLGRAHDERLALEIVAHLGIRRWRRRRRRPWLRGSWGRVVMVVWRCLDGRGGTVVAVVVRAVGCHGCCVSGAMGGPCGRAGGIYAAPLVVSGPSQTIVWAVFGAFVGSAHIRTEGPERCSSTTLARTHRKLVMRPFPNKS